MSVPSAIAKSMFTSVAEKLIGDQELRDTAKKFLSHAVSNESELELGDHIYVWRAGWLYSHHGIVVGLKKPGLGFDRDGRIWEQPVLVVHFSGSKKPYRIVISSLADFARLGGSQLISMFNNNHNGLINSTNRFSSNFPSSGGTAIHKCRYNASNFETGLKRAGSCCEMACDPPFLTVLRALSFIEIEESNMSPKIEYDVLLKNCELLARFCKLGAVKCGTDFRLQKGFSPQSHPSRLLKLALSLSTAGALGAYQMGNTSSLLSSALGGGGGGSSAASLQTAVASAAEVVANSSIVRGVGKAAADAVGNRMLCATASSFIAESAKRMIARRSSTTNSGVNNVTVVPNTSNTNNNNVTVVDTGINSSSSSDIISQGTTVTLAAESLSTPRNNSMNSEEKNVTRVSSYSPDLKRRRPDTTLEAGNRNPNLSSAVVSPIGSPLIPQDPRAAANGTILLAQNPLDRVENVNLTTQNLIASDLTPDAIISEVVEEDDFLKNLEFVSQSEFQSDSSKVKKKKLLLSLLSGALATIGVNLPPALEHAMVESRSEGQCLQPAVLCELLTAAAEAAPADEGVDQTFFLVQRTIALCTREVEGLLDS